MNAKLKIFILSILILMVICSIPVNAQETRTLTYTQHDPPTGMNKIYNDAMFDEIEKATDGRVKIEIFWSGVLFSSPEALKGISDGVVDMGTICPTHYPGQLFLNSIYKIFPEGPKKPENILWVYRTVMERLPIFREEIEQYNQKILSITCLTPSVLVSTVPVISVDDIAGLRLRTSTEWHMMYLKNLGAIPVSIPWNDLYMSLQTGVIDGVYSNLDGIHKIKLDEVASHIFMSEKHWNALAWCRTINLDTWNSLSKEDQDTILRITEQYDKEVFTAIYTAEIESIIEEQQREMGVTVNYWSEEDEAKYADPEVIREVEEIFIKRAEEKFGYENAREIMDAVKQIIAEGIQRDSE